MPLIDDGGTEGFSFVWTIQNFTYCLQKPGENLKSPSFILGTYETDKWLLTLCPRGANHNNRNTLGFGLSMEYASTLNRSVQFALSIRNTRGLFKKLRDSFFTFSKNQCSGFEELMTPEELWRKGTENYIDNDNLTLRCRIWKIDDKFLPLGQCYARTIINVEKTTNVWSLEKFHQSKFSDEIAGKKPISYEMPSLVALNVSKEENFNGNKIKLTLKQIDKNKPCFFTCDISLREEGGKVFNSVREEHRFEISECFQVWTIPYTITSQILNYENIYLHCELAASSGFQYSRVERVQIGKIMDHHPSNSPRDSLKDDLQRFYPDGMFTDLTIRTPNKEFLIHKAILCARSTVFHAMFERDMKENKTGVVEIKDLDEDTVHRMLLFAYSDTAEDLNCDVAFNLYFAADKYRITALRRRCSDFLKENLSVSNVCEVLVLANMHQDEDLKLYAQDFIMEHAAELLRSAEWKKFMQEQVPLSSEMMHSLLLQNLSI